MKDFKVSVVVTRENAGQLDEFKALTDSYGAQLRITRLRPSGRGADVWDQLHPTQAAAARALRLAAGQRRQGAHRRLVLPPVGVRRGAARAQPLRCRPGGLPDRPGRRRLRLPVRHPRELPRRQRPRRGRLPAGVAALASCSPTCAARRPAAPARSARTSTPAAAAAWRPSSSPACRSTGPTPSACRATARRRWPPATSSWSRRGATSTTRTRGPVRGQPTLLGIPAHPAGEDLRRVPAGRTRPALTRRSRPAADDQSGIGDGPARPHPHGAGRASESSGTSRSIAL